MLTTKEIYKGLQDGKRYKGLTGGFYLSETGYIRYRHYGSSAIDNNYQELKWLLDTIFNNEPITETSEYIYTG